MGNMEVFTTYDCNFPRIRLGDHGDGGYVICDGVSNYDLLISGGIDRTARFEKEFVTRYDVPCVAYDHTVDHLPSEHRDSRITLRKLMVTGENTDHSTNLANHLDHVQNAFVKMDIEASEWEWLEALRPDQLDNISQMVIELHMIMDATDDTAINLDVPEFKRRLDLLRKLNQTHLLTHVHANNWARTIYFNGRSYPSVMECTYVRKRTLTRIPRSVVTLNMRTFPNELDVPNTDLNEDKSHLLNEAPFRFNRLVVVDLKA